MENILKDLGEMETGYLKDGFSPVFQMSRNWSITEIRHFSFVIEMTAHIVKLHTQWWRVELQLSLQASMWY